MDLDTPTKSMVIRFDTLTSIFVDVTVFGNVLDKSGAVTDGMDIKSVWTKVPGSTWTEVFPAPPDANRKYRICGWYFRNHLGVDLPYIIGFLDGALRYEPIGLTLSPGDNAMKDSKANPETMDTCGSIKVKNVVCTATPPDFGPTDVSFSLSW